VHDDQRHLGYKYYDTNFKSSTLLLKNLIDIASKGGNYLLNVGPEPTGVIPVPEVERLAQMGEWLKKNGASIYATSASPYKKLPFDGRCTVKGRTLYLNVFNWPDAGLVLGGLQTPVRTATVIATGEKLKVEKQGGRDAGHFSSLGPRHRLHLDRPRSDRGPGRDRAGVFHSG